MDSKWRLALVAALVGLALMMAMVCTWGGIEALMSQGSALDTILPAIMMFILAIAFVCLAAVAVNDY